MTPAVSHRLKASRKLYEGRLAREASSLPSPLNTYRRFRSSLYFHKSHSVIKHIPGSDAVPETVKIESNIHTPGLNAEHGHDKRKYRAPSPGTVSPLLPGLVPHPCRQTLSSFPRRIHSRRIRKIPLAMTKICKSPIAPIPQPTSDRRSELQEESRPENKQQFHRTPSALKYLCKKFSQQDQVDQVDACRHHRKKHHMPPEKDGQN